MKHLIALAVAGLLDLGGDVAGLPAQCRPGGVLGLPLLMGLEARLVERGWA